MIRLFRVYYPVRTLVLLVGEALVVWIALVVGTSLNLILASQYGWLRLNNALFIDRSQLQVPRLSGDEYLRILGLTGIVLLLSHAFDLYDLSQISAKVEQLWRMAVVLAVLAAILEILPYLFSTHSSFPGAEGLVVLMAALFCWRSAYSWLIRHSVFREHVYVLGMGERARRLMRGLHERPDLGIEVVAWTGTAEEGIVRREALASHLVRVVQEKQVHRIIVAMDDRRGSLPVEELLALRLKGVRIEEATSWLEKVYGRIEVEQLDPSWLIFAEDFRFSIFARVLRQALNFAAAFVGLVLALPLLPFVALAVKLSSPGPVLYHQQRVGHEGKMFRCLKFRTMRQDAEADTGATWATDNDPRITRIGRFLRFWRLDEIPQLWCVLKGDMNFVGPRPERPEFTEWLSREIAHYGLRHAVRPGITGWAQIQYPYGNTLEDAREKLRYDLFYIKNASFSLDLWIMFQTIKIVVLGRGSKVKPLTIVSRVPASELVPEITSGEAGTGT